MRRKIMTAFVCAIMTISVIPVYADDTQTDQSVTTEVSTETAATVQETKRTQSKEQQKKKTTSKKHTKTKKTKLKKKEENKVIPMPTQVISKSSSDTIEGRIKDKQAKVKQLKKQKAKIEEEIRLEQQKARSINEFYKKYTANSKAEIALYGQEITPSMKISKKDEQLREDLYELADLFGDENLRTIEKYALFRHLIDSTGIVDEAVLDKLKLNIRSLIASQEEDSKDLLDLCIDVIYHNNMKAFGLQQLIKLYLTWLSSPETEEEEA